MNSLRIAWLHIRINVMNDLQYRANFAAQLGQTIIATVTGLVAIGVMYQYTDSLGGWTRPELYVVLGVYTAIGGFIRAFIQPGMSRLMNDIERGTFDYVLVKPVDSQLLTSVREVQLWPLTDVIVGVAVAVWGLASTDVTITAAGVFGFVVMIAVGVVLVYCLWLIVTAGAFWFVRMSMVEDLFRGLYQAGQYPITVYPSWLRLTMTYLVPMGFAVTVPAQSLTGRLTGQRLLTTAIALVVTLVVTRWFWRTATRRYSGASA